MSMCDTLNIVHVAHEEIFVHLIILPVWYDAQHSADIKHLPVVRHF